MNLHIVNGQDNLVDTNVARKMQGTGTDKVFNLDPSTLFISIGKSDPHGTSRFVHFGHKHLGRGKRIGQHEVCAGYRFCGFRHGFNGCGVL